MRNRIFALLTALVIVCGLTVTAFAHEVPALEENGTIIFTMDWNGEPLNSGSLSLYRVGDVVEDDGNYSFVPIERLEVSGLALDDPEDPALAAELANLAKTRGLPEVSAEIKAGKAVFTDVAPGLYVVVQDGEDACDDFAAISPFLISMPQYDNGTYRSEIIADPKVPLETKPQDTQPAEPTGPKPTEPKLPQTGQWNWPVPVLAVGGLMLFAGGWHLRFGRKKDSYEK